MGMSKYEKSERRAKIGLDNAGYKDHMECRIPVWRGHRDHTAFLLGDPPIGRSALDQKNKQGVSCAGITAP